MYQTVAWYRDRWYPRSPLPVAVARDREVCFHQLPEALVQDIWRNCSFDTDSLTSVTGESIRVRDPGRLNTDGGPDFSGARVRIGDVEWVGDVEIHLASEDWYRHGHQRDPRYNSVILHVTLVADLWTGAVRREDDSVTPELVLSNHLSTRLRTLLHRFRTRDSDRLVCSSEWPAVPDAIRLRARRRMTRLRLLRRARRFENAVVAGVSAGEQFYRDVFASLGYAKNADPMRALAQRIPLSTAQQLSDPDDLEALFLGTAGLIPNVTEDLVDPGSCERIRALAARFAALTASSTTPMVQWQWQFFRMRPSNFPPLRIAQGCALIHSGILSKAFSDDGVWSFERRDARTLLSQLNLGCRPEVQPFWENHYRLDRPSQRHSARLGKSRVRRIIINAALPMLVGTCGKTDRASNVRLCTDVLDLLPPEDDELTREFRALGTPMTSANESQGVHELYSRRCSDHGCLRCDVGRHILRSSQPR